LLGTFDRISELQSKGEEYSGLPTGLVDLDKALGGMHKSDLIILAARPAMGKTSLVLEIAKRVALTEQVGVAIFSLEMSKEQLVDKMLSSVSAVDNWKIRTGKFDESGDNNEFQKLGEAIGLLNEAPIWIDDSGALNVLELRSKARRLKTRHNIGLLIIDYLQLMSGTGRNYNNNRVQEVSDISRGLKILAKELDIPVIALSQLSRSVEGREDKRPMLSDLRESGSIEQDADVVMFVHREEMYHKETKKKGIADILIAKHRHGSTATVELAWIGRLATFENLDGARKSFKVNE
jgi:replicative DNA helicase